jgi:SAM-dependent methyltransferase|tara:strand:- start:3959 stop:5218 length:1260 start_codon:yes stop_codon:yes gene_type:complete
LTLTPIAECRICKSKDLIPIISLNEQYIATFTPKENEKLLLSDKFPLELVRCNVEKNGCGLVQLLHSIPKDFLYKRYFYRSGINQTMNDNLSEIVKEAISKVELNKKDLVLDIGCNDGTLLQNYQNMDVQLVGFDPAENMAQFSKKTGAQIIVNYFNENSFKKEFSNQKAKIITSIAMFYDLDDPNIFVKDISKILDSEGIWIIELSYLPLMIKQNAFDTIVHEHLEYYHLKVLERLFSKYGLKVVDIFLNEVNGGSIRLFIKHNNQKISDEASHRIKKIQDDEDKLGLDTEKPYIEFYNRCEELKEKTVSFIKNEQKKGKKIFAYGASTKGNTLLQFYGLDNKQIEKVADRNSDKWGRKTVGTEIQIISEEEARKSKPDYFLILPWHFLNEFIDREKEFLKNGGQFIVPLPQFRIIKK